MKKATSPPLPHSSSKLSRSGWILFLSQRPQPLWAPAARRGQRQPSLRWDWREQNNRAKRRTWRTSSWTCRLISTPANRQRREIMQNILPQLQTGLLVTSNHQSVYWLPVCYWPTASSFPRSPESAVWRKTAETSRSCRSWCSHSLGSSLLSYIGNPQGRPWTGDQDTSSSDIRRSLHLSSSF